MKGFKIGGPYLGKWPILQKMCGICTSFPNTDRSIFHKYENSKGVRNIMDHLSTIWEYFNDNTAIFFSSGDFTLYTWVLHMYAQWAYNAYILGYPKSLKY